MLIEPHSHFRALDFKPEPRSTCMTRLAHFRRCLLPILTAILASGLLAAPRPGCPAWEDDRRTVTPGQSMAGGFIFAHNVNRVVGMGTTVQHNPDGTLASDLAVQNGALDPEACLGLRVRVRLDQNYYWMVREQYLFKQVFLPLAMAGGFTIGPVPVQFRDGLVFGGQPEQPLSIPITIKARFNGSLVLDQTILAPIQVGGYDKMLNVTARFKARLIKFARHRKEHVEDGADCAFTGGPDLQPPNCPGDNDLSYTVTVPSAFELLNIGFGTAQIYTKIESSYLSFSAMPPVVLITGCCGDNFDFWHRPADHLLNAFRSVNMPVFVPKETSGTGRPDRYWNRVPGTIEQGGFDLVARARAASQWFGSRWVNIVAHSKGGLNARSALGARLFDQPVGAEPKIGVRSLVTMNTPHLGSPLAEIHQSALAAFRAAGVAPPDALFGEKWNVKDLTKEKVAEFNRQYPSPPKQITISNFSRQISYGAYISDANLDASQEQGLLPRLISTTEGAGFLSGVAPRESQLALFVTYNLIAGVRLKQIGGVFVFIPPVPYIMNDGAVDIASQSYLGELAPPASPGGQANPSFSLLVSPPVQGTARGVNGSNHENVPTKDRGDLLVNFCRNLRK